VGRMRIAEQTEGAGHRSENNTGHLGDARRTYGPAYGGPMVSLGSLYGGARTAPRRICMNIGVLITS
jgi:hypothetical protein